MKMIFRIARMELQKMFYSPIAWLILIVFSIQVGIQSMQNLNRYVTGASMLYRLENLTFQIFTDVLRGGVFYQMQEYLYLYIPLVTMGLLSREFSSGSIKLLYSSPVSNAQIVFGKFLSMMVFGLTMVFILLLAAFLGEYAIKDFDLPLALTAILGLYLLICAYSAIGLFMSSLTSYQVVAAIGTFATLFVLSRMGVVWQDIEFVRDITYWLSLSGRSTTLIYGLISSEDVLYFILIPGLFIAFTIFRLKGLREKNSTFVSFARYAGTFVLVALIGYVSTIPSLMVYHDATRTNSNTLTPNSQEVLSKLEGEIQITTYGNLFGRYFTYVAPTAQKRYMEIFKQYERFYPDLDHDFKFYYDVPIENQALKGFRDRYEGMTEEQILEKISEARDFNPERAKPGKEYSDEINLKSELNRTVNKIATDDGRTAYLRLYNEMVPLPSEAEITAAFKTLVTDELPKIGFVKGHGEREVNNYGSRGYSMLTSEKTFRYSLINNGFDFAECELSVPVDASINMLIISDAKSTFSDEEMKNLNDYIDQGGNLLIACDPGRQDNMNPLVARLGVTFQPGQAVQKNTTYEMDLITAIATEEGGKIAYQFEDIDGDRVVSLAGAVSIAYEEKQGFDYTPLFVTDSKVIEELNAIGLINQPQDLDQDTVRSDLEANASVASWNELQTTDFIDEKANYDPELGDSPGPVTTALAITRQVGGKEQRIMILGDADCISNGEVNRYRMHIRATNNRIAAGAFSWLSYNEVPIDVRRPEPPDNEIKIKKSDLSYLNPLYKIVIPSLFGLAFLILWLRRKSR